jgi:hypothetical protein
MKTQFSIVQRVAGDLRIIAIFHAADHRDLLDELTKRLPSMRQDGALLAMDADALVMLLKLSVQP